MKLISALSIPCLTLVNDQITFETTFSTLYFYILPNGICLDKQLDTANYISCHNIFKCVQYARAQESWATGLRSNTIKIVVN